MSDLRSENVQRFREEQGAARVYLLTAIQPFTVSQDRFILLIWRKSAQMIHCTGCTPRTSLGMGDSADISPDTLKAFEDRLSSARAAWNSDAIPAGVHDGVTITAEYADDAGYRRVRMVDPHEGTPHERLLSAWMTTFPDVAIVLA